MSLAGKNAYVTGGASGIGAAVAKNLVSKGAKVFIADRNLANAENMAKSINSDHPNSVFFGQMDVTSWEQQLSTFETAVEKMGRIDYVYPIAGIGEKRWLPKGINSQTKGFSKPDLEVIDIDLTGVLYTVSLAIQQFKKQDCGKDGLRGRLFLVGSLCGLYSISTFPIYTAAKQALVGMTRAYGNYLPKEKITLSIVCPHIVRTSISTDGFYSKVDEQGLLTPVSTIVEGFEKLMEGTLSGVVMECGPKGAFPREGTEFAYEEAEQACIIAEPRALPLTEL